MPPPPSVNSIFNTDNRVVRKDYDVSVGVFDFVGESISYDK